MVEARRFLTDGIVILIGQGLSRGLGVLLLPILTMVFLPAQFGMSALATSYVSFVSVIALLGLDLTYLQVVPGAVEKDAERAQEIIWLVTLVLAFFAAVVGSTAWWVWGKQTPESAPWLALGIFSTTLFSVCQSQMKVLRQYRKLAFSLTTGGLVMYLWVLSRGFLGHNQAVTLVSGYSLGAFTAVLISRPIILLPKMSGIPNLKEAWSLIRISFSSTFIAPAFWMISSMDRWLVTQFWGVYEAGIYSVAASISGIGLLFGGVVQTIWLTEASRVFNLKGRECYALLKLRIEEIFFAFLIVWLALTAFSGEIIHLFAKPPYDRAIIYLPWLLTSVMLFSLFQALSVYLIIKKSLSRTSIIWFFGGAAFLLLSILAFKIGNSVYVAISQVVVYAVMVFWVYWLVREDANLEIKFGFDLMLVVIILVVGFVLEHFQTMDFDVSHFLLRLLSFAILTALVAYRFKNQFILLFSNKTSKEC